MLVPSTERLFLSAIGKKATATHTLRRRGPLRTRRGPGRAAAHRGRGVHHPRRRHRSRPSRREVDAVDTGRRWGSSDERGGHGSSDRAPRACSVRAAALASQLISVHLVSRQGGCVTALAIQRTSGLIVPHQGGLLAREAERREGLSGGWSAGDGWARTVSHAPSWLVCGPRHSRVSPSLRLFLSLHASDGPRVLHDIYQLPDLFSRLSLQPRRRGGRVSS